MTATHALVAHGLTKSYGERTVDDSLDFAVRRGSITGFLGPNGAGKTTMLRMLLGLVRPGSGTAVVCGVDIATSRPPLHKMGAVIETPAAWLWLCAADVLAVCARSSGLKRSRADIDGLRYRVGLAGREGDRARTFSGGMKQRLGLACALLSDPEVLILDEPMNGLDPQDVLQMRELLAALCSDGCPLLISSHQLAEIQQLCTDIIILAKGKERFAGPMSDLAGVARLRVQVSDPIKGLAVVAGAGFVVNEDADALLVDVDHARAPEIARLLVNAGPGLFALEPLSFDLEKAFVEVMSLAGTAPAAGSAA